MFSVAAVDSYLQTHC